MNSFGANCLATRRRLAARFRRVLRLAFVTKAGVTGWLCLAAAQAPSDVQYYQAVRAYRQGQHDSARRVVSGMDDRLVEQAIAALARGAGRGRLPGSWSAADVQAAVVQHTELAVLAASASTPDRARHVGFARRLAGIVSVGGNRPGGSPPRAEEFLRQWHLVLARQAQGILELDEVAEDIDILARRFEADAEVLLTAGTLSETLAWPALSESLRHPLTTPRRKRSRAALLADAEQSFRRAVELDPRVDEARLRLGRVLLDQGRSTEALVALETMRAQSQDARVQYLGRLFSGAACERLERWEEAEAHYLAAVQLRPDAQSGIVALSFARQRLGRLQDAAEALRPLMSEDGRRAEDPWWDYYFGQWRQLPVMLAEMRQTVRE